MANKMARVAWAVLVNLGLTLAQVVGGILDNPQKQSVFSPLERVRQKLLWWIQIGHRLTLDGHGPDVNEGAVTRCDQRDGHDYITTATSGAMNMVRPGAMDHVVWITMTANGPKVVNLLMNGIMDKKGPPANDDLEAIGLYRP